MQEYKKPGGHTSRLFNSDSMSDTGVLESIVKWGGSLQDITLQR